MYRLKAFGLFVYLRIKLLLREPEALFWVFVFPLLLVVVLALAFWNRRPEPLRVDVVARPGSPEPEKLKQLLNNSGMNAGVFDYDNCRQRFRSGRTDLFVEWDGRHLIFDFDPTRPDSIAARYQVEAIVQRNHNPQSTLEEKEAEQVEAGARYIDFLIPGLMGMHLLNGGLYGVGFTIVDLRIRRLLKMFLATPMKRSDLLAGLMLVRILMIGPEMFVLLAIGNLFLGVPIRCGFWNLAVAVLIGGMALMAIGLLLGCRTEKLDAVTGTINLIVLPQLLLSGVFFSSKKFPDAVQPFIQALPLTQMNDCLRELMLEGKDLFHVAWRLGILAAYGMVCFVLGLRWFRWS
jgi:ABC-2 type transport system permease protein